MTMDATREWARLAGEGWKAAAQISAERRGVSCPDVSAASAPAASASGREQVVRKGFLVASPREAPAITGDVEAFLQTTARKVMEEAGELMAKEAPETTPFKFKYEAREQLVCIVSG